jgi:serine/threonine-protein phosphatase 6 regulatory subunit 3
MFWRMTGFSPPSAVDSILDKETCTVEDLFDEEEIIQECKTINNRLVNFLRGKEQMQRMLCYIVQEPPEGVESKRAFRFSFIACEIFTCEIDIILKTLVEEEELMNLLFSFLESDRLHRTLLVGYFSKVVICLLLRKTVATIRYIQAHQEILAKLVNLIGIPSIMEVLIRLVGADNHMYAYHVDALQWLADTNLLEMLVDALSSTSCPGVHQNAAETLCAITHLAPSALALRLSSPSFVERLFCNALENPQSKSTLVHSLSVCISLLDPKRSTFAAAGAAWGNHISEPVIAPNPETVDGMLHGLGQLLELLNVSSDANVLPTTYGELRPPLGMHRLKIVEFIAVLLKSGSEVVWQELVRLGAIQTIIKLFFEYPFNNSLHHYVECIISSCLESNSTIVIDHLFQECDLLGKLLVADEKPFAIDDPSKPIAPTRGKSPPRIGNMGHITRIANRLCHIGNTNIQIQAYLQANTNWNVWQMTTLQSRNTVQNVLQWACGRPTTIQERNLDNDEDEFRDRDYDISAMTNNLAEAFRYGMVENEDIGDVHGTSDKNDEDVFFDDESAEVVSSLHVGEEDESGQLKDTMFTNPNWFAFQDEGSKESPPTYLVSSPLQIDDNQINSLMTLATNDANNGSDDEVVVGEDEEIIDTSTSNSSFATTFDTEFGNDSPQSTNSVEDLSLELEKVGISDNSSPFQCEGRILGMPSVKTPDWVGWRESEDFEGTSGRNQLSKDNPSEIEMTNAAETGYGSTLSPPDQRCVIEMDAENSKGALDESSSAALKEGSEAEGLRGRMGLPSFVENVEFVGVEV